MPAQLVQLFTAKGKRIDFNSLLSSRKSDVISVDMIDADKKVLIIEDNVAETIYAQAELMNTGFRNFKAVATLSEGLDAMPPL